MSKTTDIKDRRRMVFNIGEESLPTIVGIDNYKESPFYEVINKGLDIMNDLYRSSSKDISCTSCQSNVSSQQHIYPNNIVAFLGERGSGKTSCLLSTLEVFKKQVVNGRPIDCDLCTLDVIDPSFFDKDHNILEFFIGEFYKQFKKGIDGFENFSTDKRNDVKKIQSEFSSVKHAIEFIESKYSTSPIDELDDVRRLSSGIELSHSLYRLISLYLKFVGKKCLVIVIDDLDLNIDASYRMMEQIRMNLVLPNVMILMAAKLEQLKLGIENNLNDFADKGLIYKREVSEMATRYLDKLLPIGQRVFMPDPDNLMKIDLHIQENGEPKGDPAMTQFVVLQLIFQKTRFLFYNHEDHASLIIPRNLRELRMLVTALFKMRDPGNDISIHEYNKAVFKEYFIDQWVPTLSNKYESFARSLINENALEKVNKKIVEFLLEESTALKAWQSIGGTSLGIEEESELQRSKLKEITDVSNYSANLSVGDVMYVVSLVKELEDNEDIDRFVFFIHTFYSIRLYELYDEMTDNLDDNGIKRIEDSSSTIPVLRNDRAISMPDYHKLVGGGFFTVCGNSFMPTDKFGMSREISLIDGFALRNEISSLIKELGTADGKWKEPSAKDICRINLLEFFILCSRRRTQQRSDDYSWRSYDAWRTNIEISYMHPFTNTKNIVFDITAPFFTIVYPKIAYDRYSSKFYELALNCEGSLLYKLLNGEDRRYPKRNRFADLMSRICIRNMEVRWDLEQWLRRNKSKLRPDQLDAIGVIIDFFSRFNDSDSSYSVKTYDKVADSTSYQKIDFIPLSRLADVLREVAKDDGLKKIFYKIYSPSDKIRSNQNYKLNEFLQKIYGVETDKVLKNHIELLARNVTNIFKKLGEDEVRSETVVKELFEYPLLPDCLLSELFDKVLRSYYISNYLTDLEAKNNIILSKIKEINSEISKAKKEKSVIEKSIKIAKSDLDKDQKELEQIKLNKFDCIMQKGILDSRLESEEKLLKEVTKKRDECFERLHLSDEGDDRLTALRLNDSLRTLGDSIDEHVTNVNKIRSDMMKNSFELSQLEESMSIKEKDVNKARRKLDELTKDLDANEIAISSLNTSREELSLNQKTLQKRLDSIRIDLASYK